MFKTPQVAFGTTTSSGKNNMIILFDLDGTLIDSTDAIVETFHYTFDRYGLEKPDAQIVKSLIGYPLDIMFGELGVEQSRVWDFVDTYKEEYRKISTLKTELLPCAVEAVKIASEIATLAIVTTKTGKYSKVLMEHFDLMEYFDLLIGREDVDKPKPDAQPILRALEHLPYDDEVWMIGDTKLDIISANEAKVKSIGVLSGYGTISELKSFTNVIFNDALEAVLHIKGTKN